jgi:hypothetical protein
MVEELVAAGVTLGKLRCQVRGPGFIMIAMAAEKNSTSVLPISVELLGFVEEWAEVAVCGSGRPWCVQGEPLPSELRLDSDQEGANSRQA